MCEQNRIEPAASYVDQFELLRIPECSPSPQTDTPSVCLPLLELLLLKPDEEGLLLSHRAPEPDGHEVFLDWRLAWHYRIFACIHRHANPGAFAQPKAGGPSLLYGIYEDHPSALTVEQRARTVRMLLACDALFLSSGHHAAQEHITPELTWLPGFRHDCAALTGLAADFDAGVKLSSIIDELVNVNLHLVGNWHVPIVGLIVIATACSQSQLTAPIVWEAFSAAYTNNHLRQTWRCCLHNQDWHRVLDPCIAFISFLIRYQHAISPHIQEYRHAQFHQHLQDLADRHSDFTPHLIWNALTVFSLIAEFRNRSVLSGSLAQSGPESAMFGELDLASEAVLDPASRASHQDLPDFVTRALSLPRGQTGDSQPTWSLYAPLAVSDETFNLFKDLVQQKGESNHGQAEIAVFALDRGLMKEIPHVFQYAIAKTVGEANESFADRSQRFDFLFATSRISIPPLFGPTAKSQFAVEVKLEQRIAAYALLFPQEAVDGPGGASSYWKMIVDTRDRAEATIGAGALMIELFEKARKLLKLDQDALDQQVTYVPFPFIRRLLDVIARLKGGDCVSVALTFDDELPEYIYFPWDLPDDSREAAIICNYIHARVLNRAMTRGYFHCSISSAGLDRENPVADYPRDRRDAGDWRRIISRWHECIRIAYNTNVYWLYADKYVRDFQYSRRTVEIPDPPNPWTRKYSAAEIWENATLLSLCDGKGGLLSPTPTMLLLGIDIGGTLVKIQFYKYVPQDAVPLQPLSESLHINTPLLNDSGATPAGNSPTTRIDRARRLREVARAFADDLVGSITRVVQNDNNLSVSFRRDADPGAPPAFLTCVGVAWPGAVRDNRIVGTSGILAQFPPLTRNIDDNRIEDLLELDIAAALKAAFQRSPVFGGHGSGAEDPVAGLLNRLDAPIVSLINDGTAEGYGSSAVRGSHFRHTGKSVVVKIGTGLASCAFENERPLPGIWEGGKIALDLGAAHNGKWIQGDASSSVSKRFMPQFARTVLNKVAATNPDMRIITQFDVTKLDSQELGYFLADLNHYAITPLCTEFGLRDLAFHEKIDVEILRRVYTKRVKAEPDWQNRIARLIGAAGNSGIEKFKKRVEGIGYTKLSETLGVAAEGIMNLEADSAADPTRLFGKISTLTEEARIAAKAMTTFREAVAIPAAEALGRRLGDLIVTLWDLCACPGILVTGGVMSGKTEELALAQAEQRVQYYGLQMERDAGGIYKVSRSKRPKGSVEGDQVSACATSSRLPGDGPDYAREINTGAYGAAIVALGVFIDTQQQRGREWISAHIKRMKPNTQVQVIGGDGKPDRPNQHRIVIAGEASPDQSLSCFALTAKDTRAYIEQNSAQLQVYLSDTGAGDSTTYVRWPS